VTGRRRLSSLIGVSPYAGVYPNNGSAGGGGQSTTFDGFHYVATTSSLDQHIIGYLAINSDPPQTSQPIDVHATPIAAMNNTTSAAGGFTLAGCTDFTSTNVCLLAPIGSNAANGGLIPAMYLSTTNGIQIGLLTALQATTAVRSLPLRHSAGTDPRPLKSAPLTVSTPTTATFSGSTSFTTNDSVDTNLVTHGILVPIANIPF
jgi:hypothetical protein